MNLVFEICLAPASETVKSQSREISWVIISTSKVAGMLPCLSLMAGLCHPGSAFSF